MLGVDCQAFQLKELFSEKKLPQLPFHPKSSKNRQPNNQVSKVEIKFRHLVEVYSIKAHPVAPVESIEWPVLEIETAIRWK